MADLNVGDPAPEFTAESTKGIINLKDYRGKNVALYFYVRDQTPGCTTQSINLRDGMERLRKEGIEVIGVSTDSLESHKKFAAKHNLEFPLVADIDKKISRAYGVLNEERGTAKRVTFVIDKDGIIKHIFKKVNVNEHAEEVLAALK